MINTANKVDEFIASQPENIRNILDKIRTVIKEAVPEADELFSYGMPAFKFHGIIAWYAHFKNHYSVFIRPQYMDIFKDDLKDFHLTKSAIRFPVNLPVQIDLIKKKSSGISQKITRKKMK